MCSAISMKPQITVNIIKQTHVGFSTDVLVSLAAEIIKKTDLPILPKGCQEVDVVIVNSKKMKEINSLYGKDRRATDVLSFSYLDDLARSAASRNSENTLLGEIFINAEKLKNQARLFNHSYREELSVLFTHGMLHVVGFDHCTKGQYDKMMAAERNLLGDKSGLLARGLFE